MEEVKVKPEENHPNHSQARQIKKIAMFLFALIIIPVFCYVLSKSLNINQPSKEIPIDEAAQAQPTPVKSSDDWKIYNPTHGNFSIKFPQEWNISSSTQEGKLNQNLGDYIKTKDALENQNEKCPGCLKIADQKEISVNNNKIIVQEVSSNPSGRQMRAYFMIASTIVELNAAPANKTDANQGFSLEVKNEFDKMLSTITILESNPVQSAASNSAR